ncbi:putative D-methionine-binding lipoprotein metQ precursor [Acetoanaerobium sticklandii]|uniref:Putative D-methionine-binding lipoprotein metQ n=1 Tax=Acetoanaerobium sticklandii (strain ATCC 12662 / DSM 519 / JCM 1433 / CCUG 9281 / NCIMB 10654 / HF) TaxID=499177 RepID=E3PR25_ACESD|nr:MetQ/NlpA family ABC transporter substrate-binding protein [Acetoanaerobium sticklandii]CBH20221.1 putative D-methionine-binding lipoprotein metQ precursor [Acetoanaerobium sticklandii]
MKSKKIISLFSIIMLSIAMVGCSINANSSDDTSSEVDTKVEEKEIIKIGTTGFFKDIVQEAKKDFESTSGYELEVIVFDDNVTPNIALDEGSIDVNFYQHVPFLDAFNKERGTNLVKYGEKGIACTYGIYSSKLKSLEEIPNGAKIGIANDSSNRTRGLRFLESNGFIKIKDGVDLPTKLDVIENPKNLDLIEIDGPKLISSMEDVDAVVGYGIYMLLSGKDPKSAIIFDNEEDTKRYADVIVLREDNKNVEWVKHLEAALTNEKMRKYMDEELEGAYIPAY